MKKLLCLPDVELISYHIPGTKPIAPIGMRHESLQPATRPTIFGSDVLRGTFSAADGIERRMVQAVPNAPGDDFQRGLSIACEHQCQKRRDRI
ncbi:MAG: hypothetical protein SOY64_08775 [Pyramidobacter sp.]|nr:hypothetical protein [Pyramidobacter sp.]